jgi:hypothetical protein
MRGERASFDSPYTGDLLALGDPHVMDHERGKMSESFILLIRA